jgi:hypothetical protein
MANKIDFFSKEELEQHECVSEKQGDWVVFTCPQCDYRRQINLLSDEMKTSGGDPDVLHRGMFAPVGFEASMNMN